MEERLGIAWGLSSFHGWGVFGVNLARSLMALPCPRPLLLRDTDSRLLSTDDAKILRPLIAEQRRMAVAVAGMIERPLRLDNACILYSFGNGLPDNPVAATYRGARNFGFAFTETTRFPAGAVDRLGWLDGMIAGSAWNREVLSELGFQNVRLVHQGVEDRVFRPGPKSDRFAGRFAVFSGGKLEFRKGQDLVLAAFKRFHAKHPEALLVAMWGNPWPETERTIAESTHTNGIPDPHDPPETRLANWVARQGIAPDAFLDLGHLPNPEVAAVLRDCDAALFPNRAEGGTNLVAMEAMACGVPTVLAANTGQLDLIRSDRCYPLHSQAPVADPARERAGWGESDVDEIVAALDAVRADPAAARRRGDAGARFMAGLSWRRQTQRLLEALGDG